MSKILKYIMITSIGLLLATVLVTLIKSNKKRINKSLKYHLNYMKDYNEKKECKVLNVQQRQR